MSHILSAVAWPYANGPRHIGHVAGFGVPSDVFSRYMRMAGHDVLMVSGTDEHGTPILVAADEEGVSARELADRNNRLIVEDLVALGLSYDLFTRTTAGNHYRVVQEMFRTVRDNGYMIERVTRSAISPSTGRTLPDRYIEAPAPYAALPAPAATSATPAATSSTPPTSSAHARGSTVRPPSSWRPLTGSSTCPPWLRPWVPGSTSARPPAPGGPTSSSSPRTSWGTSARAP